MRNSRQTMPVKVKDVQKMTAGIEILYAENTNLRKAVQFLTYACVVLMSSTLIVGFHAFIKPLF